MKRSSVFVGISGLFISLFCLISMYIFPGVTKSCTLRAIMICGRSLIPSLFPYMVLTRLILQLFIRLKGSSKFHTSKKTSSASELIAIVSGMLSGSPTGAVLAGNMYSNGMISRYSAETAVLFSSVASPAFCIGFYGGEIMKSRILGALVYIAALTVNFLMLAIYKVIYPPSEIKNEPLTANTAENGLISEIIYDSCITTLTICAYVTFFVCTGEVLYTAISYFIGPNPFFKVFFIGAVEMTSGIVSLEGLSLSQKALCGASVIGFQGLSVMMQTASVCNAYGIGCKRLFIVKLISAITVPAAMFVLITVWKKIFDPSVIIGSGIITLCAFTLSAIAFFAYFVIKQLKKYKKSKVNL